MTDHDPGLPHLRLSGFGYGLTVFTPGISDEADVDPHEVRNGGKQVTVRNCRSMSTVARPRSDRVGTT